MSLFDEINTLADLQTRLIDAEAREGDVLEYKAASRRLASKDPVAVLAAVVNGG